MKAIVNQASQDENRTKAAIGSTLFHAALLAMLFFYVLPVSDTPKEPTVIELDFGGGGGDNAAAGDPDAGMNDDYTPPGEEPTPTPSTPTETAPEPAPTPTKSQATPPPTSPTADDPDVAAIKQQKEQDRKKREETERQERARQDEINRQQAAVEEAKRAEQAKRDRVKNNAGSAFGKPGSNGQGAGGGGKPGNGGINGGRVMSVNRSNHMPAICLKARGRIVREPAFHMAVNGDAVVVIQRNELGQAQCSGQ